MTNTTTLPADWAIERAIEVGGFVTPVAEVRKHTYAYPTIINVARYIEEREQPPVDPWLLQAREVAAGVASELACEPYASRYREGVFDDDPEVQAIAAALLAAFEQGKAA